MTQSFVNENVNEKVFLFNKFIINIFSNCVSNEAIFCDNKDCPKLNKKLRTHFLFVFIYIVFFHVDFYDFIRT